LWSLSSDDAPSADQPEQNLGEGGEGGNGEEGEGEGEIDLEEVDERYSDLAEDITVRATACEETDPAAGAAETLECTVPVGTLTLTTFETEDDLEAGRLRVVDTRSNTLAGQDRGRFFFAFDPEHTEPSEPGHAELYWDSKFVRLAAHLEASSGVGYSELETQFGLTFPTVEAPTGPGAPRLVSYINEWDRMDVSACRRVFTYAEGEIEENQCTVTTSRWGEIYVYAAAFRTRREFIAYRESVVDLEEGDGSYTGGEWCNNCDTPDEVIRGEYHGYVESDGSGVFYLDDPTCRCYLEAVGPGGDRSASPEALSELFFDS
jgi:hypothetical protein